MKEIFNPVTQIKKEAIFKRMRPNATSRVSKAIDKQYDACLNKVMSTIDYQALIWSKDNVFANDIIEVKHCEKIVFCFVTIGEPISNAINSCFENSNFLEGYLLNEIANEVVIDATNQMYAYIKKNMKKRRYHLTKRLSPGECSFDMKYQNTIMGELKKGFEIKASLTESFMIDPEKSTLFLYGADKNIPESNIDFDCSSCQSTNCAYRRAI